MGVAPHTIVIMIKACQNVDTNKTKISNSSNILMASNMFQMWKNNATLFLELISFLLR